MSFKYNFMIKILKNIKNGYGYDYDGYIYTTNNIPT